MEKFDFKKPVAAEVVFEDSDYEEIPNHKDLNNISQNETNKEQCCNKTTYNMPDIDELIKQKYTELVYITNNQSSENSETSVNTLKKKKPRKRKLHVDESDDSKVSKEKCVANEATSGKQFSVAPKHLSTLNTNNGNENANDISTETTNLQNCLKLYTELIGSVCENLVMIVKVTQNLKNYRLDPSKRNSFITRYKNYYLTLSYTTVATVFIPRKDNVEFRNHVISLALEIAKKKNVQCVYRDIEPLYHELIKWSEWKKTQIQDLSATVNNIHQPNVYNQMSPSTLQTMQNGSDSEHTLNQYQKKTDLTFNTINANHNTNYTVSLQPAHYGQHKNNPLIQDHSNNIQQRANGYLINQTGNPQSSFTATQEPTHIQTGTNNYMPTGNHYHSITNGYIPQRTVFSPPPYPAQFEYGNTFIELPNNSQRVNYHDSRENNIVHAKTCYPKTERLLDYNNFQTRSDSYLANRNHNSHLPNVAQPSLTSANLSSQPMYQQTNNIQQRTDYPQNRVDHNQSQSNIYSKSSTNVQTLKDQAKYQRQEEWPNLATLLNSSDNASTKLGQNDLYTQLEISTDKAQETRNSLSRDSGFMSPEYFNINGDEMLNITEDTGKSSEFMPIITHITSLNPTAVFLDGRKCVVCGKSTRNKCLRCYINYYCSYDCQALDWKRHNQDCTNWTYQNSRKQ